jgi:hypothetical protein
MNIKSKQDLIEFVKKQVNIELSNDSSDILNKNKKILYTQINRTNAYAILPILIKYRIRYKPHVKDNYFIYVS